MRKRGYHGDLYRCTAATPCEGYALHNRRNRGACGVSAEAANGHLLFWTECPGQEPAAKGEMTVEYLTTRQVAERLQVPRNTVRLPCPCARANHDQIKPPRPPEAYNRQHVDHGNFFPRDRRPAPRRDPQGPGAGLLWPFTSDPQKRTSYRSPETL